MKRLLFFLTLIIMSISAVNAKEMALLKLFDGRYNDNQQIEWSKIKRDGKTSYFMNFKRLPNLEKEIMELLKKDMQGFEFDTEVITKNERYYKAIIERNGEKIEIGYSIHMRNGAVELFIKGPNKAFQ